MKNKPEVHELDAQGRSFGRLASEIASLLQGKRRPDYAPHIDFDITVKISNIDKLKITGKKAEQKLYYRYTGYPGGLKTVTLKEYLNNKPHMILYKAVNNMLPKNKLRSRRLRRLILK